MTVITVLVPDDLAPNQNKEREYDVAFTMERAPRSARPGSAKFNIHQIWDTMGQNVNGSEFALVAAHALDCYYEEMLAAANEPWTLGRNWPRAHARER